MSFVENRLKNEPYHCNPSMIVYFSAYHQRAPSKAISTSIATQTKPIISALVIIFRLVFSKKAGEIFDHTIFRREFLHPSPRFFGMLRYGIFSGTSSIFAFLVIVVNNSGCCTSLDSFFSLICPFSAVLKIAEICSAFSS